MLILFSLNNFFRILKHNSKIDDRLSQIANRQSKFFVNKFGLQTISQQKLLLLLNTIMRQEQRTPRENRDNFSLSCRLSKIEVLLGRQASISRMEERFQDVPCQPIRLAGQQGGSRKNQLRKWLGNSCKEIFSIGFALYQKGDLDEKKAKAFCSQNLLRHVLELSQVNDLGQADFEDINALLKKEILPYFLRKYPLSEDKQANLGFSKKVTQIDNQLNSDNDLIFASKVKFEWRENGNYNDKVMEFLNYLIGLPELELKQNKEQKTLFNLFQTDMEALFKSVEVEDEMLRMKNFDPEKAEQQNKKSNQENRKIQSKPVENLQKIEQKPTQKQLEEYRDKVKGYTDYLIGRKLSQNIQKFSQEQIKNCNLNIKNSALMRVVTKWCEELEKCFTANYTLEREEQLRMMDGSTKFLARDDLVLFEELLQKQYVRIKTKLQGLMKHNYNSQSEFSKLTVKEEFLGFMEEEGKVGQFSSMVFRNNESYLVSHLNNLLHGILTATKNLNKAFQIPNFEQIRDKLLNEQINLHEFLNSVEKEIPEKKSKENEKQMPEKLKKDEYLEYTPQIITFLVGDLLRCKCSSHENEIVALFNEIQKMSQTKGEILQIVRVKNRLDSGTKDILVNLMYRNTLVIEMQLAIKTGKTKFLDCSTHFNHYLYELKRSQFGPLSELSNIWTNLDFRGNFYLEQMDRLNQPEEREDVKRDCCSQSNNFEPILEPFECSRCGVYYSQTNYIAQNIKCKKCHSQTCLKCRLGRNYSQSRKILKFLPDSQNVSICKGIPEKGLLVNLISQKKYYYFKKIKNKKSTHLFIRNQKANEKSQFRILIQIKEKKEERQFLKDHFIIESKSFDNLVPNISLETARINFFLPEQLKMAKKLSKTSISIVKQSLNDQVFESLPKEIKLDASVKKINFSQNNLYDLSYIFEKFANAEVMVIDRNKIKQISEKCHKLKCLKSISFQESELSTLPETFGQLESLQELKLSKNRMKELPLSFGNLKALSKLSIWQNQLTTLPETFGQLESLQELKLSKNRIKELPLSFGNLKALSKLSIWQNQLTTLPQTFGDLKSLQELDIDVNKLKELPLSFGNLKNLSKLSIWQNQLSTLPKTFGDLVSLSELDISKNRIKKLPLSFGNLTNLSKLNMQENELSTLPEIFGDLASLSELDIGKNRIKKLPLSFGKLKTLSKLIMQENELSTLPQTFGDLASLSELDIDVNKLKELPLSFGNLKTLSKLSIWQNQLSTLPETFGDLESLSELDISKNRMKELPLSFGNLKALSKLSMWQNQLTTLPETFGQLESLQELKLSKNRMKELPLSFGNLKALSKLSIWQNQLSTLHETFGDLVSLSELDISKNIIKKLPLSFGKLKTLSKLIMQENELSTLPQTFGDLVSLSELDISKNRIKKLPLSFGNLKTLSKLSIWQNQLSTLPETFGDLASLSELDIDINKLKQLPPSFGNLKNLSKLIMQENELSTLPETFGDLESLSELDISKNIMKQLPLSFGNLKALSKLNMQENEFSTLPETFGDLASLSELDIDINKLKELPLSFGNLKNLSKLQIWQNQLTTLHETFGGLASLSELDISKNRMKELPLSFGNLKNLSKLIMQENKLSTLPETFGDLESLSELDISKNRMKQLPLSFGNLKALQKLQVQYNQLLSLPESFGDLVFLSKLNISFNKLKVLPHNFGNLIALQKLSIQTNQLQALPKNFGDLVSLFELNVNNNPLEQFISIGNLVNLNTLTLRNNKLESITSQFLSLSNLKQIDLRQNSFTTKSLLILLLIDADISKNLIVEKEELEKKITSIGEQEWKQIIRTYASENLIEEKEVQQKVNKQLKVWRRMKITKIGQLVKR